MFQKVLEICWQQANIKAVKYVRNGSFFFNLEYFVRWSIHTRYVADGELSES